MRKCHDQIQLFKATVTCSKIRLFFRNVHVHKQQVLGKARELSRKELLTPPKKVSLFLLTDMQQMKFFFVV